MLHCDIIVHCTMLPDHTAMHLHHTSPYNSVYRHPRGQNSGLWVRAEDLDIFCGESNTHTFALAWWVLSPEFGLDNGGGREENGRMDQLRRRVNGRRHWRAVERDYKSFHDPKMKVSLPRLRCLEEEECEEAEGQASGLQSKGLES